MNNIKQLDLNYQVKYQIYSIIFYVFFTILLVYYHLISKDLLLLINLIIKLNLLFHYPLYIIFLYMREILSLYHIINFIFNKKNIACLKVICILSAPSNIYF